jgi:4-hydroxy-tetrahydrodipicolinate synthase
LDQASEVLSLCDLDLLSGDDSLTLPLLAVGGKGVISVASNLVPADVVALVQRFLDGDTVGARALHQKLFPLVKALFCEPNPVPAKHARRLLGLGNDVVRLPLTSMPDASAALLRAALVEYGLLDADG